METKLLEEKKLIEKELECQINLEQVYINMMAIIMLNLNIRYAESIFPFRLDKYKRELMSSLFVTTSSYKKG